MRRLWPAPGFRGRLMLAMLTLMIVTSVTIAGVMMVYLFEGEKSRAADQLNVAEGVAREVMDRRNELLISRLQVVVDDFGFKSALASRDIPTITSALDNQSTRAGADLALLVDSDDRLIANLQGLDNGAQAPFSSLLDKARERGFAADIDIWNGTAYQLLVVPIKGPGLRAWLIAGFTLNDGFARFISGLTGTDVVFRRKSGDTATLLASSLGDDQLTPDLMRTFDAMSRQQLQESTHYFIRAMSLGKDHAGGGELQALLLSDRGTALASYYRLAVQLSLVVLGVLVVAGILVMITARALGRPVLELARFASDIGEGKATTAPRLRTSGELKVLGNALTTMLSDIRERERWIQHNATHDDLTGLLNRKALDEYVRQMLASRESVVAIGFTLADFKAINDTLGFSFGDRVIVASGLRLRGQLPADCVFGRTGGNEYLALIPQRTLDSLDDLLDRLHAHIRQAIVIEGTPISLKLHIAILRLPEQANTVDEVRRRLNLTFDRARRIESHTAFYEPGGDESHLRELRLIRDLQGAMNNGNLTMNYQPKIHFDSAELYQVEALIRWHHPDLGFVNPEEFIMLAERSGQIHALTEFILGRVAEDARQWRANGLDIGVAINLSALDLTNRRLTEQITATFADWQHELHRLTFEITESAIMSDSELALQTLADLRALGVKLSVDDFGTGYSSLAQLRKLPVHELKIDKSFVLNLDSQAQDQLIVRSTIDMAHGLGLSVVAEGIENVESWALLQQWGCNLAQGFFLARPLAPADLTAWADTFSERRQGLKPSDTLSRSESFS
ncbi:MAG: EAL domain-containing protein [Marinobacter sp.]|nr:EAL domain-containing protein [Marinobacter sp.]